MTTGTIAALPGGKENPGAGMRWRVLLAAVLIALPMAPVCAITATSEVTQTIEQAIEVHSGLSEFDLPPLSPEEMEELGRGETLILVENRRVVDIRDPSRRKLRYRALALHLMNETHERLWLAFRDPHFLASQNLTEVLLSKGVRGDRIQYQHFRLPWPFRDRQSVVRSEPALELAQATDNRMWELAWNALPPNTVELHRESIDPQATERAVWLPVNTGAWTQIVLDPEYTLVAYQLTVLPGGRIPVGLARAFAKRELSKLLSDLGENAGRVRGHYIRGHKPIFGGDGLPIPPFDLSGEVLPSEGDT